MSTRSGKRETLHPAATYDAVDTWYECPQTIELWSDADQLRLYIHNTVANAGQVCFKIQLKDLAGVWCDVYGSGASWCTRSLDAGDCIAINLNGAGLCEKDIVKVFFQASQGAESAELEIQGFAFEGAMWSGPGLESNGGTPVNIQDQTSPAFDLYFIQQVGVPSTSIATATEDTYSFDVTAGHGTNIGDYVGLFSTGRFYFGTVTDTPSTTTIEVDTPLDFPYPAGSTYLRTTRDLNVDGSVTRQIFQIGPFGLAQDIEIDITRIMFYITSSSPMDDEKFGGLDPLPNGLVLRRNDGSMTNYFNVKTNGEFANHSFDAVYSDRAPSGFFGYRVRYSFAGQDKHGVAVRLKAGDTLELLNHDALQTLTSFRAIAEGHVVTD